MTQYYILKPAVDTEETGHVFPAVESYDDYDFKGPNSVHNLKAHQKGNEEIDFRFKLSKGAHFTDLLSHATISGVGILISEKLHSYLRNYRIIPYQLYKVPVAKGVDIRFYWYMHFVWVDWNKYVNWGESTFRIFENNQFSPITFNSYEEYKSETEKSIYFRVGTDKVMLYEIPFDLFSHPFLGNINVSTNLAKNLKNSDLTGIEILPSIH